MGWTCGRITQSRSPKTEGTVFPNTDQPRLVNDIFIFFPQENKTQVLATNHAILCLIYLQKILDRKQCWGVLAGPKPSPVNNQK